MTAMARLASFLFVLWVGVTVSTGADLQKRIIGGQDCKDTERLYHVQLQDKNNNFLCGGSLISDEWVLTAAHCWEQTETIHAIVGVHPGPGTDLTIPKLPKFFSPKWLKDDLMLLKLPQKVKNITPVKLPDCQKKPQKSAVIQIAGHGSTVLGPNNEIPGSGQSRKLKCADITVADCALPHTDNFFCAHTQGVDICGGDSGGGAVFKVNGEDMIFGVIRSNGDTLCSLPVGFMNICYQPYYDWIKQTTGLK